MSFRRIIALVLAGHFTFAPTRAMAQEVNRFKNSSEQDNNMANGTAVKEKGFDLAQLESAYETAMRKADIPSGLSLYQQGQLLTYCLFQFYKLAPEEREGNEDGATIYGLIIKLYNNRNQPEFKKGLGDADVQRELVIKDPSFADYVDTTIKYEDYRKEWEKEGRRPLPFANYLLEGQDKVAAPKGILIPVKVEKPTLVDDATLDEFISRMGFAIPAVDRDGKIDGLNNAFSILLGSDIEAGSQVAKAVLTAYWLSDKENRKLFIQWLNQADKKALETQVTTLTRAKTPITPHKTVQKMFEEWKKKEAATEDEKSEEQRTLEVKLRAYPKGVRETSVDELIYGKKVTDERGNEKREAGFENDPTGQAFDYINQRLAYLRLRQEYLEKFGTSDEKKELETIQKDYRILERWLDKININTAAGTLESRLEIIRAGLATIQGSYFSASWENLTVVDYLKNLKRENEKLYDIFTVFLLKLDEKTGRFFVGMDPKSRNFLNDLTYIIADKFSELNVREGKNTWVTEGYHDAALPTLQQMQQGVPEALAGLRLGELKPLIAIMFLDYYKTAVNSGVLSPEEKKLVATTLSKLYSVNPLLAVKYLASIKHIAEICIDNPGAYLQGLTALSARIDTEIAPIYSPVTPFRVGLDLSVRRIITKLDMAFDDLLLISAGALSRFTRYNLLDRNLELNLGRPPHEIVQKPPGYKYPLTLGLERRLGFGPPYPFPNNLFTTPIVSPISRGAVVNAYPYGGGVTLPQLRLYTLPSGADSVKQSMEAYLWPTHPVLNISEFLPGAYISPLSATQLVNEINRAFISRLAPGYEFSPIGGGGALGVRGRSPEAQTLGEMFENIDWGGGGLGSIITTTGGISAGGLADGRYLFAGISAIGVPIGHIPLVPTLTAGHEGSKKEEIGIDSLAGGYERLDDESKRMLLESVKTAWDPNNPSEVIIAVNKQESAEGKGWMTARYYYIDKEGTIYELKGGTNDFVEMLNYMAGYGDKNFNTPATYAWNIEPGIDRGGGALAVDISKFAGMMHMQAVPFFTREGQPQPMLLEWTPGAAYTEDIAPGKTRTYELVLPGKWLKLKTRQEITTEEGKREQIEKEREYTLQEGVFTWRTVEDVDAWETTIGLGLGKSPSGAIGRAGFFRKAMTPKTPWDMFGLGWKLKARGAGLYYEMGATNLEALALLQESEEAREFVENIHRIGVTLYGQGDLSNKMLMGALAHVVPQFTTQNGDFEFDRALWRFIGFLKALDAIGKLDVARIQGFDQVMSDYNSLMRDVNRNPAQAETLLNNFRAKNVENIRKVFDNYYLGVQINRDMSLEFNLLMREDGDRWIDQKPETIYGRFLWTFGNNFWRAFASIPIHATAPGLLPQQTVGIGGTGFGFDAFEGFWGQRVAFDLGILLVNQARGGAPPDWGKPGAFVHGAAQLFSNIVEDYSGYKKLEANYKDHSDAIKEARFNRVPAAILEIICNSVHEDIISPSVLAKVRAGEEVILTPEQTGALLSALYSWFYDERVKLEKVFNGHFRSYIGAGAYVFNDNVFFDIGGFAELVDKLKVYAILAKREEWSAFTGADYNITRNLILGTVAGVQFTGEEQAGGGVSVRYKFPAPFGELAGFSYIRSRGPPAYAPPAYAPYRLSSTPEFGFILFYTIGEQTPLLQSVMTPTPGVPTRGAGY